MSTVFLPANPNETLTALGQESILAAKMPAQPAIINNQVISLSNGTSAIAEVLAQSQPSAVQSPIVPLPAYDALTFLGVKPNIEKMTLDEKFTCLKQCFAYGYGVRKVLCTVFESIRAEFKTYKKDRGGMPTVEEAFKQRGLDYKTIYSAIEREKDRRAEDAQLFADLKAKYSPNNIHGLDVTDNDLPPVGTKVILCDGTKGQILIVGEKAAPDAERSFEVVTEDGSAVQVKRGDLITMAEKEAAKATRKAAQENNPATETKKTARIAAAAAKQDATLKSSDFYAAQYFSLIALINGAPKEFTAAEFAQTAVDNLTAAYQALNAEEAKMVTPAPRLFPSFSGTKGVGNLLAFLSADALGRPSPLKTIFTGLDGDKFANRLADFAQRIADLFYDGKYVVAVTNKTPPVLPKATTTTKAATPPTPDQPPATTKVGDKSKPTAHGFYFEFIRDSKPYGVRDANNQHLGILCKLTGKTEAARYINEREREAAATENC